MVLRPRNNWVWTVSALTQPRPEGCPPRFSAFYPLSGLISVTRTCSDHTGSVSSWLFSLEGFGTTGRTQQCWLLGLGRVQEGRGGLSLSVVVGTEVWWGQACPELSSQPRLLGKAHSSLCPCQFWEQGKWGRLLCFLRKLRQETRQAPGSPGPMLEVNLRSLGSGPCGAESRQHADLTPHSAGSSPTRTALRAAGQVKGRMGGPEAPNQTCPCPLDCHPRALGRDHRMSTQPQGKFSIRGSP